MFHPTKPIGPFYSEREARAKREQFGWAIVEDAARGYRRVVPSPEPLEIVEEGAIRRLIDTGVLVIAGGGGGIPVVMQGRALRGVEAVIDKDRASALLAARLGTQCFIISTDADRVYLHSKADQRPWAASASR
jgi:carbamate kinase